MSKFQLVAFQQAYFLPNTILAVSTIFLSILCISLTNNVVG